MISFPLLASRILRRDAFPEVAAHQPVQPTFDWRTDWMSELMTLQEIEVIEEELERLAWGGDEKAAARSSELKQFRQNWEKTATAEDWDEFVYQAQSTRTWLRIRD